MLTGPIERLRYAVAFHSYTGTAKEHIEPAYRVFSSSDTKETGPHRFLGHEMTFTYLRCWKSIGDGPPD